MTNMTKEAPDALSLAALASLGNAFARRGKRIYLVGGMVRDRLLGRQSSDYDFTTDAVPEESKHILSELCGTVFQPGERYGTICALLEGFEIQVTTFRGDRYAPGSRKPEVRYGVSLEEDLARRDFTINALALAVPTAVDQASLGQPPSSGDLVDPFGGRADLGRGLIRAVGQPADRFAED